MGSLTKKPKVRKQEPTGQERALSRRQDVTLSREIAEENRRKKALTNILGTRSLLAGLGGGGGGGAGGGPVTGTQFSSASTVGGKVSSRPASLLPPAGFKPPTIPTGRNLF